MSRKKRIAGFWKPWLLGCLLLASGLDLWSADNCGGISTELTLSPGLADCPPMVSLSGTIFQINGDPAPGITVLLEGDLPDETVTDAAGHYSFSVPSGALCRVRPCAGGGLLNGVSTIDMAIIQLHILGLQALSNPYALIRADVNNDGAVDPLDLADLRKLLLGTSPAFPRNAAWRFVPTGYIFPDPLDPFQPPFPEILSFQPVAEVTGADFFILKSGDLGSAPLPMPGSECGAPLCKISGRVYFDENADCEAGGGETSLAGRMVRISGGGEDMYTRTLAGGRYEMVLPPGNYQVQAVSTQAIWTACPAVEVEVFAGEKRSADLGMQAESECPWLRVSAAAGVLSPCETETWFVAYENRGSAPAFGAQAALQIDPWMTLEAASLPWTSPDGVHFFFELGDLAPEQTGGFTVDLALSCDALPGQAHRVEARIGPDYLSCLPPDPGWDGAALRLEGHCAQDTVRFELHNDGAAMQESLDFIVIEDDMIMRSEPFQLGADQMLALKLAGTGATYRLTTVQTPGHPGLSRPTLAVEGCGTDGNGDISLGFVGVFPEDEDDDFGSVSAPESLDEPLPFYKDGYPKGYRGKHLIEAGGYIDYQIRFQNTGDDTLSAVAVIDSISQQFDWTTFLPGAASHPYTAKMTPGVGVIFLMENTGLPPAAQSAQASRGFVSYRIRTRTDLPDGTLIRDPAEVFFNNQPTATLITSYHTIGSDFVEALPVGNPETPLPGIGWQLFPNPAGSAVTIRLPEGFSGDYTLRIRDPLGRHLQTRSFSGLAYTLERGNLPAGIYYFTLESSGRFLGSQKMVFPGIP